MAAGPVNRIKPALRSAAIVALCTYVVFEAVVTVLYLKDVLEPTASICLFEDSGKTIQFDAVRGYRLTEHPSRVTRITRGTIEYVGTLRGNNQGFPDRDDFRPERGTDRGKRFAVFGDSFTAAQFIGENWPDHVEDLTRNDEVPLHLLNFSVDGGGLANWWSVMTKLVVSEGYEIDGVIFAVCPGDLWRKFAVCDHRDQSRHMFGRVPSWDPKTFPVTLDDARKYLHPLDANIVSPDEFNRALRLTWRPPINKPVRPYFAWKVWHALRKALSRAPQIPSPPRAWDSFDPGQEWMIEDLARTVNNLNVPVMVIHIPSRDDLLHGKRGALPPLDTRLFAELIGARLVDGEQAFAGRSEEEIRALWLRYDAHWAQSGSDTFGACVTPVLRAWSE